MEEMAAGYVGPHTVLVQKNRKNQGLATHINILLNQAKGTYFSWAAGDDVALPSKITDLIIPILRDQSIIATHSAVIEMNENGKFIKIKKANSKQRKISRYNIIRNNTSVISQSHLFKTSIFSEFGPFSEALTNEGPAISFREICCGKIYYVETPLTKYRIGSGVSTYRGSEVTALQLTEPAKVILWRLTSFQQILTDMNKTACSTQEQSGVIRKIKFYSNLYQINTKQAIIRPLILNLLSRPLDLSSLRAAIRVSLPPRIYRIFMGIAKK